MRFCSMAWASVWVTCSCPTTSAEALRPILSGYDLIRHLNADVQFDRNCARCQLSVCHSAFAIVIENARVTTADAEQTTVAAFRPWRGS